MNEETANAQIDESEIAPTADEAILVQIQVIIHQLRGKDGRASGRGKAVAITKLQEAGFWITQE